MRQVHTLLIVPPTEFNILNHMYISVSNYHVMVELKILACMLSECRVHHASNFPRICLMVWQNVHQFKIAFNPGTRRNSARCPDVLDKFKRDEQLELTATIAPVNLCEGSLSVSDQSFKKKLNIRDITV
jgi:hypothetical protein